MATPTPKPINPSKRRARHRRIRQIADSFGFTGRVEYRHVYSQTGGAEYGLGTTSDDDLLTVYAEAFERDADPEDFSLAAILAHERGHQLLARHPRIARQVAGRISVSSEEILASLLGAMISTRQEDRNALVAMATIELLDHGETLEVATRRLQELWNLMEVLL